jgi:hypothetical protein
MAAAASGRAQWRSFGPCATSGAALSTVSDGEGFPTRTAGVEREAHHRQQAPFATPGQAAIAGPRRRGPVPEPVRTRRRPAARGSRRALTALGASARCGWRPAAPGPSTAVAVAGRCAPARSREGRPVSVQVAAAPLAHGALRLPQVRRQALARAAAARSLSIPTRRRQARAQRRAGARRPQPRPGQRRPCSSTPATRCRSSGRAAPRTRPRCRPAACSHRRQHRGGPGRVASSSTSRAARRRRPRWPPGHAAGRATIVLLPAGQADGGPDLRQRDRRPGVTTSVLALAFAWHRPALVVEADMTGRAASCPDFCGAHRHSHGLVGLSINARSTGSPTWPVEQCLRWGGALPAAGIAARPRAAALTTRLGAARRRPRRPRGAGVDVLVDAGRLAPPTPAAAAARRLTSWCWSLAPASRTSTP